MQTSYSHYCATSPIVQIARTPSREEPRNRLPEPAGFRCCVIAFATRQSIGQSAESSRCASCRPRCGAVALANFALYARLRRSRRERLPRYLHWRSRPGRGLMDPIPGPDIDRRGGKRSAGGPGLEATRILPRRDLAVTGIPN